MEWEQPHWSGRQQPPSEAPRRLRPNAFAKLARLCVGNRYLVIGLYVVFATLTCAFAAVTLTINPDGGPRATLDDKTSAAQQELDRQFPGIEQGFLAIVENTDSEAAKSQALALAATLTERSDIFEQAFVPGTGGFYDTNAMLYRDTADLKARVDQVMQMQPLYHALAAAPDVLGLVALVGEIGKAVEQGHSPPGLDALLLSVSATIEGEVTGDASPIPWLRLAGLDAETRSTRWFVVATPKPGLERAAAAAARLSSSTMEGVRWLWPQQALAVVTNPLRDFMVPAILAAFFTVMLMVAGLGSIRLTLAVLLNAVVTLSVCSAAIAVLGQPLDGATWSYAGAVLAPAMVSGIVLVLAYQQARTKGLALTQAIMLAAQRRGVMLTVFGSIFCAFWLSWAVRQLPSLGEFAVIAFVGAILAWISSLTLLPAAVAAFDHHQLTPEPHWLDEALAEPASHHIRQFSDIVTMVVLAAAIFSAAFLPGVRFGERHIAAGSDLALETPDARGAIHILAKPEEVDAVVRELAKLPEIGAIRTISQFLPPDTPARIGELRRLEGVFPAQITPRSAPEENEFIAGFAELEQELAAIATSPSTDPALRETAHRMRRAVILYVNPQPPSAARIQALEDALFSGLNNVSRTAERLAKLQPPRIADLDPRLLKRFVSSDGQWRIEVMPKPGTGVLSFAGAIRRILPLAAGEPVTALARNEIIHHETLLALAAALVAAAILVLAALRSLTGWIVSLVPVAAFVTLTAAALTAFDIVLNMAMLAAASATAAVLISCSVVIAESRMGGRSNTREGLGFAMRAGLLPPLVLAAAVAPLTMSTRPPVAELGGIMSLLLLIATVLGPLLIPPLSRWFRYFERA